MKRVLLGMSGGVDSSVAAFLLKQEGYEVIGVTLRIWKDTDNENSVIIPGYIKDAVSVAKSIDVKHITVDVRKEFKETVVEYFISEYLQGRTPFPCALCNPKIKWKILSEKANELNCNYIATGHYVKKQTINTRTFISKGIDKDKDQSFFLWPLDQEILKKSLFPLGSISKKKVRDIAIKNKLGFIERKKESTGICFLKDPDYRKYISKIIKERNLAIPKGNFYSLKKEYLGQHNGYPFFTVGQRRGLGIHFNKAYYVTAIKPDDNTVVLAGKKDSFVKEFFLKDSVFIYSDKELQDTELIVKVRYRKQKTICKIYKTENGEYKICLRDELDMVAPGQTAVFYDNSNVVGGGFIK